MIKVTKKRKPMYISYKNGKYGIYKSINNKTYFFGAYKTLKEAKKIRNQIIMNGWKKIKTKKPKNPTQHIYKNKNKFRIIKQIGNKTQDFGTYNTLEEAIQERKYLIENGWEYDYIDLL